MTGQCCDLHDRVTPCGPFDICCNECPVLSEPRWNVLHTGLVLASFIAGFGWWALA